MDARPADGVSPYTSLTADNPWTKTGWPTPAPPPTGRATLAGTDSSSGDPAGTAEAIWIAVGGVVILVALFIGAYVVYMRVWYDVGAGEALARLLCGNSGGGQIGAVWKPRGATRGVDLGGRHSTANSGPEFFRRQAAAAAASAPASTSASASARAPASAPALTPSGAGRAIAYPSTPSSEHERDESFISFGASSVSPFERIAEASTSRRAEPPLAPGASAAVSPLPASQPIQPGRSDAPSMYVTGKLKAKHHHYHHHHQHHHPHHHHPHTQAHSEPKHGKHGQSSAAPLQPATGSALPPHLPVQHASDTMIAHAPSSPAVTADVSTSLVLAADEDLGTGVSLLRQSLVPFSSVVYVEGDDSASGGDGFSTLRRGRPSTKGEHPAPGADSTTAILGSMFVPMPKAKTDHEKSTTPAWAARSTPGADTSAAADMRSKTYPPPLMPQPLPYAAFATPNVTKPAATATASSGLPRQHRSDDAQSQREHAIEFLKFASLQRSRSKSSAASSPGMGLDDAHRRDEHPTSGQGGAPRGRSPATLERHRTVEHQLQQLVTVVHDPAAEHHMSMTPSILFSPHAGMHIGGHGGGDTASVAYTFDSAETGVPVRRGTLATMASSTGARSIERARSLARSIERGAARGAITDTLVESPVDEPRGLDADKPPASQPPQHLSLEEPMQLQQPPQPQQQADEAVTPESTRFDLTFISVDSNREGTTRASLPAGGRGSGSSGSNRSSGFHAGLAGRFLLNALAAADAFDLNAVYTMPRTPQAAPLPTPPVPPAAEPSAAEARSLPCASDGGADGLTAGGRKRDMRLSALPPAPPGSVASSGPSIAATPISTHTALAEAPQLGESTDGSCASASPARDARQLKGAGPGPRARGPRDGISPAGFRGILSPLADSVAHTPATETDALMPVADASPSGYFDYRGPHAPARCEADGSGTPRSKLTGAVRLSSIAFDMGGHSRIDSGASSRSHGSANSSSNFLGKSSGGNTDARAGTGAEMQAEADDKAWNRARFSSMVSLCTDVSADLTVSLAGIISGTRRESTLSLGGGAGGISVRRVSRASAAHRASARLTLHARSSSDSSASLSMFSEAILLLRPGAAGFSRMAGAVES